MNLRERALELAARTPRRFVRTAGLVRVLTVGRKLSLASTASFLRLTGHCEDAERVLAGRSREPAAVLEWARVARDRGDVDAALERYAEASRLDPRAALREVVDLAVGQGRLGDIVAPLGRACIATTIPWAAQDVAVLIGCARVLDPDDDEFDAAHLADPRDVRTHALLEAASIQAAQEDDVAAAREASQRWLDELDELGELAPSQQRRRAAIARELLDDEEAARRLEGLAARGDDADRMRYADVLLALRRPDDALAVLRNLPHARAHRLRGAAYREAGRYDEASAAFACAAAGGHDPLRNEVDALLARRLAGEADDPGTLTSAPNQDWTAAHVAALARAQETPGESSVARALLRAATGRFPCDPTLRHQLARMHFRGGAPSEAIPEARAGRRWAPRHAGLRQTLEWSRGEVAVAAADFAIEHGAPVPSRRPRVPGTVLHLLETSLPHRTSGYAVRSHYVLTGLRDAGIKPVVATRPGFPADYGGPVFDEVDEVDGIGYRRLPLGGHPRYGRHRLDRYLSTYAEAALSVAAAAAPVCVHASSNFKNGLVGRAVARQLEVPFVYELRGLWEDTQVANEIMTRETERYQLMRRCEDSVLTTADAVVTLSAAMADDLVERGVARDRIFVARNGIDAELFAGDVDLGPLRQRHGLGDGPVLGYISSLVRYEGVETLLAGYRQLRATHAGARLLVVGDGAELPALRNQATQWGLDADAIFVGRVPHDEVARYYRLIDLFVVPRIQSRVTSLVLPIKPAEALAAGCAVVVSDLPALRESISAGDELLGATFMPGDAASLAAACAALLADAPALAQLREKARAHALEARTWSAAVAEILAAYRSIGVSV